MHSSRTSAREMDIAVSSELSQEERYRFHWLHLDVLMQIRVVHIGYGILAGVQGPLHFLRTFL